jgi:hypothetical protein
MNRGFARYPYSSLDPALFKDLELGIPAVTVFPDSLQVGPEDAFILDPHPWDSYDRTR